MINQGVATNGDRKAISLKPNLLRKNSDFFAVCRGIFLKESLQVNNCRSARVPCSVKDERTRVPVLLLPPSMPLTCHCGVVAGAVGSAVRCSGAH